MIKTAVLGSCPSLLHQIKALDKLPFIKISGLYCDDKEREVFSKNKSGFKLFNDLNDVLANELIVVLGSFKAYYEQVCEFIKKSGSIYIEDFGLQDINQIKKLIKIAEEAKSVILFGKKEQYIPAFPEIVKNTSNPRLIEVKRNINQNGLDVKNIIFNHLVYDINMVLNFVGSEIRKISASGDMLFSKVIDLINLRLEFVNGAVANVLIRATKNDDELDLTIFQHGKILNANLNKRSMQISHTNSNAKISSSNTRLKKNNHLNGQFISLYDIIKNDKDPFVNLHCIYNSLSIANQVYDSLKIEKLA